MTDLKLKLPDRPILSLGTGTVGSWTELKIVDGLEFDAWEVVVQRVLSFAGASAWWVGDALVYGEWNYGEKYRAVLDHLELDYDRARDYAYVANNVPPAVRRPDLSFYHHRAVAKLAPVEQERWLARAAGEQWTVRQLRDAIAGEFTAPPPAGPAVEPTAVLEAVRIPADAERVDRWRAAADAQDEAFSEWAAHVLDQAAADVLRVSGAAA